MAQVTSPIILDSTGQQIHSDLQQIKTVLTTPSAAEDITFDNTGTGMQADDVQDAITELKSNLTDLETVTTSTTNAITYTKCGNMRRMDFNWSTWSNIKTFYNALSSSDKPTSNYFSNTILACNSSYAYGHVGYIKIENGVINGEQLSQYNASSNQFAGLADSLLIKGCIEWYV